MALGPINHHSDFPLRELVARKDGVSISVCIPAHNEEPTVGTVVACVRRHLLEDEPLVDEVLVVDDHSTDGTAEAARAAGARVVPASSLLGEHASGPGKGQALWKSAFAARGDLLVWCDADIRNFGEHFVRGLVGPLLSYPEVVMVKGFYRRPEVGAAGGGRVTELVARPALSIWFPELAGVVQPLGGEFAARRAAVEAVPFVGGYGVDLGLLLDVAEKFGASSIAQVDLDQRVDRNRSLDELGPQAMAVLATALRRAGIEIDVDLFLRRPGGQSVALECPELPPLRGVAGYRST